MTPDDVALLRLVAQRVAGPPLATPGTVVGHLTAVQAQDEAGALLSVALRCGGTPDDVRAAFDAGELARTWPMRGTLHTVLADDLPWLVELCTARPRAAAAKRRGGLGLSEDDVARAAALATEALTAGSPPGLTRPELLAVWERAGLDPSSGRGYHLLAALAQQGLLCLGPYRDGVQVFVLVEQHVGRPRRLEREEALAEVALRYLRGHGPATVADLARWTGLPVRDLRGGVAAVRDRLAAITVNGTEHLLDPETLELYAVVREAARDVVLLPGFDEVVLGYADRSMTVPPEHADRVVPGGNGVFRPTVVADGRVVGTWRTAGTGRNRRLEVEPFEPPLPDDVAAAAAARWAALP